MHCPTIIPGFCCTSSRLRRDLGWMSTILYPGHPCVLPIKLLNNNFERKSIGDKDGCSALAASSPFLLGIFRGVFHVKHIDTYIGQ